VIDVAVDIRKNSSTYGKYYSIELSEENKIVFWIPPGFAHGFISLENNTIFTYKCTEIYNKESEGSIVWNDPDIGINWGVENPLISEKDMVAGNFKDFKSKF
jgi:dTDP-4-dehydrorhamnose 3,5-epimerase